MKSLWKLASLFVALAILAVIPLAGCSSGAPAASPSASAKPSESAKASTSASPSASASASAKPSTSGEPYKIGFTNSMSGFMANMGSPERDVVLALQDRINAQGGINGHPIQVVAYDDQSDATQAVLVIKKLIEQDKVLAIAGTSGTGFAMPQAPIAEEAQVPFMTMNSSRSILTPFKKWVFKLPLSEVFYVDNMFKFMKQQNWSTVALFTPDSGFGKEAKKYFEDNAAKAGVKLAADEVYGATDKDMTPQLTKMKGSGANVLVVYSAEAAGAIAVGQAKGLGYTIPIFAPESIATGAAGSKELMDGLDGVYVSGHKPDVWQQLADTDKQKKINAEVNDLIQKKYNHPSTMWEANGYDAFMVLMEAVKRANPDPSNVPQARQKIRDAMETIKDWGGAASIISFSADSHEVSTSGTGVINQISGGKFKLIKAID